MNPGINVKVTMYSCLLPEFHVTGALRRILTGVPDCGALLRLWITLNLSTAGSGENLRVQKEGTRVNAEVIICSCLLPEFHLTGALCYPWWRPLLRSSP
jgi:hypothetical protein